MNRLAFATMALMALPLMGCGQDVARIVAVVQDDAGVPVTSAPVVMFTFKRWIPGPEFGRDEFERAEATTDTNGVAAITMRSARGEFSLRTMPMKGFYFDRGIDLRMTNAVGGRWEPWGETNVLVVRGIVNPIPMYAMKYGGTVPVNGKPVGFDLMKGDWVAPHGIGEVPDFVFFAEWKSFGRNEHRVLRFNSKINLTFSNEGDGIREVRIPYHAPPRGSVYRMPRFASDDGYAPRLSWMKYEDDEGHSAVEPDDINYFFRVRTKRDERGRVISTHYGKLHGPIQFWVNDSGATFVMTYYLNPAPNDRNTEFDPKRNLLKVEGSRRVIDP